MWSDDIIRLRPWVIPQKRGQKQIFRFNFSMPFEVNNFAIQTWNVVLVFECRFVSENVCFICEICVLIVE